MIGVLCHLCVGQTGSGEPPENGEMNEMTLPSRHKIRHSSIAESLRVSSEETFILFAI